MATEKAHVSLESPTSCRAEVRGHVLVTDKPSEKGGKDAGIMSSEMYLVALASCTLTSIARVAEKRRVHLTALSADAECDIDDRGDVSVVRLVVRARSGHAEKDVRKAFELGAKSCTIEHLTRPPIEKSLVFEPA